MNAPVNSGKTRFDTFARILASLGTPLEPRMKLLDFGCGGGELTRAALRRGFDAYGCDIAFAVWLDTKELAQLQAQGRVKRIIGGTGTAVSPLSGSTYRLPFEDAAFDVVISDQVLEHVCNYAEVVAELKRVMKPGAVFLHILPARYRPIEAHLFVPFCSFFHPRWWLTLWARLGVRNVYQKPLSAEQTVAENERFLATMVNYLTVRQLREHFKDFSPRFVERKFMRESRAKLLLVPWLYRTFGSRVIFGTRANV